MRPLPTQRLSEPVTRRKDSMIKGIRNVVVALAVAGVAQTTMAPPAEAAGIDYVAHRGHGDSTAASYVTAARAGAVLEGDLQLTRDNVVVIAHDARMHGRCAGTKIKNRTWAQVHRCDSKIITLGSLIKIARTNRVRLSIEFKANGGKTWTKPKMRKVYRALAANKMVGSTEVYSFHTYHISKWRSVMRGKAKTRTGINVNRLADLNATKIKKYGGRVAARMDLLTPARVKALQASGVYVMGYTARTSEQVEFLRGLRVNGIVSDIPI